MCVCVNIKSSVPHLSSFTWMLKGLLFLVCSTLRSPLLTGLRLRLSYVTSETRCYGTERLTSWSKRWQFNSNFLRSPFLFWVGERVETGSCNVVWACHPQQSPQPNFLGAVIPGVCHQAGLMLSISYTEISTCPALPCLPCPKVMVVLALSGHGATCHFFFPWRTWPRMVEGFY